ncbi:MAG: hypothetical protein ACYTGW_13970 [Planctomycetota bacterium]|jgi:hypothetical protein
MTAPATKRRNDRELNTRVTGMVSAMAQSLGALVDRPLKMHAGETMHIVDKQAWLDTLSEPRGLIRGGLDQDYDGKSLCFLFDIREAITLSCCLMMSPEEVIQERRSAGKLEGEDLEAFGEVGNVICSGVDDVLGHVIGHKIGLRVQDHAVIDRTEGPHHYLTDGMLVVYSFALKIEDHEETEGLLVFDMSTAEDLNGAPLEVDDDATAAAAAALDAQEDALAPGKEEEIEQAPIRGKMAAYLATRESQRTISRSCRRKGLELQRFSRNDIPNPAAHKQQMVLIEIPVGEDRRFDWAKRLKEHRRHAITVVILLHAPSRRRVVQGCLAKADAIVAWPCAEPQLSEKLGSLLGDNDNDGENDDLGF